MSSTMIKHHIYTLLEENWLDTNLLEVPQDRSMGDFAYPCFSLAKEWRKAPAMIAIELAKKLTETVVQNDIDNIYKSIVATWPYINFKLTSSFLTATLLATLPALKKESLDISTESIAIESPGPNTNKPLHLWHVRNMLLWNALADICKYSGMKVSKVDIVNDRWVHICKSMLAYQEFGNNAQPDKKPDHYVGNRYVRYDQESKKNPDRGKQIQDMLVAREAHDPTTRALWLQMRDRALEWMRETYDTYGCHIDKVYYESDHYLKGKALVEQGLTDWLFQINERGNIIFVDDVLGEKVLLRSDGTSIYITQDMALGKIRYDDLGMDRMVYVVGNEQQDHFKFLFKLFEVLSYEFASKCHHLSYGMISLPDGKMKSREWNVVDADTLYTDMKWESYTQVCERHPDMSDEQRHILSGQIAMAAIKFFVLIYDAKKDFVFDRQESLRFDGESWPYIQYTHARCCSLLRKGDFDASNLVVDFPEWLDTQRLLVLHILDFTQVVLDAADQYKPHLVARYLLELAKLFNTYYQQTKILDDNEELTRSRLGLVYIVQQLLSRGLALLGIEAPYKM